MEEFDDIKAAIKYLYSPENNFDDELVWDILCAGKTLGIFQVESKLCQDWIKKAKPRSIEDLSAVISIIRPGVLEAEDEKTGKSLAALYCERKNGISEVEYLHPSLEPILKNTYGILTFQEDAMMIAKVLAGFDLQQADSLRKACGKKLPEEMAKVKTQFIDGCKKLKIVDDAKAAEIFGWIEKGQRYSFNRSHAVQYAVMSYISAYLKTHFPLEFYRSWLFYAQDAANTYDDIRNLVFDAKKQNIDVCLPNIATPFINFKISDDRIYFGFADIRGIGQETAEELGLTIRQKSDKLGAVENWSWVTFLLDVSSDLTPKLVNLLILTGALDIFGIDRQRLEYEYGKWTKVTKNEQSFIRENRRDSLIECLKQIEPESKLNNRKITKARYEKIQNLIDSLESPPYSLKDTADFIAYHEESYLGVAITCSKIDGRETGQANTDCKTALESHREYMTVGVVIDSARQITTKRGKNIGSKMAIIDCSDASAIIDGLPVFPSQYEEFGDLIYEGNTVVIRLGRNKNKSLMVEKVWQV